MSPRPKDNFCLIEISNDSVRALKLTRLGNELVFRDFFSESKPYDLAGFIKKLKIGDDSGVLFLYNDDLAATFFGGVRLGKGNCDDVITEGDFDFFLNTAVHQFFGRFRNEAVRKIAADDINIVLANSRLFNIKLDGHPVLNPVGLTAKFAEVEMEHTYISRLISETVEESFPKNKHVLHIESAGAISDVAGTIYPNGKLIVANVRKQKTRLLSLNNKMKYMGPVSLPRLQFVGELGWGSENITTALTEKFGINENNSWQIMRRYGNGELSGRAEAEIKKAIEPEVRTFHEETSRIIEAGGTVAVFSDAPFLSGHRKIQSLDYEPVSFDGLKRYFGLNVSMPPFFDRKALSPVYLAGFIAYFERMCDNYYNASNKYAKWLMPESSR